MNELPTENQYEKKEGVDLENLSFEELKEVFEKSTKLAEKSFKEIGNGFQNINGEGIAIREKGDKYEIAWISDSLKDFHFYVLTKREEKLEKDFNNKEELMQKIRKMIKETGNRIIE